MVAALVLTAAPVDVDAAAGIRDRVVGEIACGVGAIDDVDGFCLGPTTVPATALVACVPPTEPPDVLIMRSLSVSGLCQNCGATSMITWYWLRAL